MARLAMEENGPVRSLSAAHERPIKVAADSEDESQRVNLLSLVTSARSPFFGFPLDGVIELLHNADAVVLQTPPHAKQGSEIEGYVLARQLTTQENFYLVCSGGIMFMTFKQTESQCDELPERYQGVLLSKMSDSQSYRMTLGPGQFAGAIELSLTLAGRATDRARILQEAGLTGMAQKWFASAIACMSSTIIRIPRKKMMDLVTNKSAFNRILGESIGETQEQGNVKDRRVEFLGALSQDVNIRQAQHMQREALIQRNMGAYALAFDIYQYLWRKYPSGPPSEGTVRMSVEYVDWALGLTADSNHHKAGAVLDELVAAKLIERTPKSPKLKVLDTSKLRDYHQRGQRALNRKEMASGGAQNRYFLR